MASRTHSGLRAAWCVALLAGMAPSTHAYRHNALALEGAAARSNGSAGEESGLACCCSKGDKVHENPPSLRGYCPEEACMEHGMEAWDVDACSSHYLYSCWKRHGCGTIGMGIGAGDGPSDALAPPDPLSVFDQFKGNDFSCPHVCDVGCCQMTKSVWGNCKNNRCTQWKCLTSEAYGDGEIKRKMEELQQYEAAEDRHVCESTTAKQKGSDDYKTYCQFTEAEKRQEPWDHGRNPIFQGGLDDADECKPALDAARW